MKRAFEVIGIIAIGIIVAAVFALLLAWPAMLLWNWLVPIIAGGAIPTLTYWQMVGLMLLLKLLIPTDHAKSASKGKD